ncbi:MAG TPA: hypothetical protein VLR27_13465 [Acidimicrobiales bacterium]|nr:hypothetical protein [Acidimicrobiales bacterium]
MPGDEETEETGPSDETIARLRSRAEQLQAARRLREQDEAEHDTEPDAGVPALEDEDEDDEDPFAAMLSAGAPLAGAEDLVGGADPLTEHGGDPDAERLLDRWAEEERDEAVEPKRNWSPLIAVVVVLAVAALAFAGARALITGSADDDTATGGLLDTDDDGSSVLDEDTPSLEDLTSDVTLPPGPDAGLQVADQGITIVPDRFDESRREGTFAVIVQNPHDDWLAQGVQVSATFLDEGGQPLGADDGFVEVVLPGQSVAVASLFFDAPTVPVAGLDVQVEVARWRETGPVAGGFSITEVQTNEAEFSGVRTTFLIQSDFDEPLTDVGVTAVYRTADGRIIGGYDTFVDRLDPGVATLAEIDLLANVDPAQIASTELYPTAAFGSVPD